MAKIAQFKQRLQQKSHVPQQRDQAMFPLRCKFTLMARVIRLQMDSCSHMLITGPMTPHGAVNSLLWRESPFIFQPVSICTWTWIRPPNLTF
jgi:hypothetical protein